MRAAAGREPPYDAAAKPAQRYFATITDVAVLPGGISLTSPAVPARLQTVAHLAERRIMRAAA